MLPPAAADAAAQQPGPPALDAVRRRDRLRGLADRRHPAQADETGKTDSSGRTSSTSASSTPSIRAQQWIGTVRWRVRAIRSNVGRPPANGLPAVSYGAWSPIYSSTNPAVTGGRSRSAARVSDVVSDGSANRRPTSSCPDSSGPATSRSSGAPAELFRVYVFTDRHCLNPVFTSAVIGSPAYAPRPFGPLEPAGRSRRDRKRAQRLPHRRDRVGRRDVRRHPVRPQEQAPPATPTTTAPADDDAAGPPSSSDQRLHRRPAAQQPRPHRRRAALRLRSSAHRSTCGTPTTSAAATTGPSSRSRPRVEHPARRPSRAPAPRKAPRSFRSRTRSSSPSASRSRSACRRTRTPRTITAIGSSLLTISTALGNGHSAGDPIKTTTSNGVVYRDIDLPQDACKPGRDRALRHRERSDRDIGAGAVRHGPLGHRPPARRPPRRPALYGRPLVAWTPALGAQMYEVEWSAKAYPFVSLGQRR